MTGMWVSLGIFVVLVCVWAWDKYVTPVRMTRPPVKLILDLIDAGKIFSVYDKPSEEDFEKCSHPIHYVILDPERKVKTYLYFDAFYDSARVTGDLDWMNEYEKNRVLKLVKRICDSRHKAWVKASQIETKSRNERRRDEAKKIYGNR